MELAHKKIVRLFIALLILITVVNISFFSFSALRRKQQPACKMSDSGGCAAESEADECDNCTPATIQANALAEKPIDVIIPTKSEEKDVTPQQAQQPPPPSLSPFSPSAAANNATQPVDQAANPHVETKPSVKTEFLQFLKEALEPATKQQENATVLPASSTSSENGTLNESAPPVPPKEMEVLEPPMPKENLPEKVEYYLYTTIPDNLRVHQKNAIRSWIVLDPPPRRIILFCNNDNVIDQVFENTTDLHQRRNMVLVFPVPKETQPINGKSYPYLDGLFQAALSIVKSGFKKASSHVQNDYFLAYTNGDIIMTQSFARTMLRLEGIRRTTTLDVMGIARRFNVNFGDFEIPFTLQDKTRDVIDKFLHKQRKEIGEIFFACSQDLFVYTPRTYSYKYVPQKNHNEEPYLNDEGIAIPDFVSATAAWDNWLNGYAVQRSSRLLPIYLSMSSIILHHNHDSKIQGSHENPWNKHNGDLYNLLNAGANAFVTYLPYHIDKHGSLKKTTPIGDEWPMSDYSDS